MESQRVSSEASSNPVLSEAFSKRYANTIKNCRQELQEEDAKLSKVIRALLKDFGISEVLDQLASMQIDCGVKECTPQAIAISVLSERRTQNKHKGNLKLSGKIYANLLSKLVKEIKSINSQLQKAHEQVKTLGLVPEDDLKAIDAKTSRYEAELKKFQSKYPWLANPQLDLVYIMEKANTLQEFQSERDKLNEEVEKYQGLKPNIREASQQLEEMKQKHSRLRDKMCKEKM